MCTMNTGRCSQDGLPKALILPCAASRVQQAAAIRENLRLTELQGDGESPTRDEGFAERLPTAHSTVAAEGDVGWNDRMLQRVKPLPH
ncbi:MAG: hypothetical protein LCH59_13585 [Proteobacteria bacterium]|nr:hypothetical protein [Pseudomonadota bacterium]